MPKSAPNPEEQKFGVADVAALQYATNIDRRTCRRTVPMKVLCFGPSRSGTASPRQALIDLGYKDCYHFNALLSENPPDQQMWIEAIEAKCLGKGKPFTRKDWDQLLGHCQAVTDTPCVWFWKEIMAAYPDAKIVITKRDSPEQWHASQMNTIVPWVVNFVKAPSGLYQRLLQYFTPVSAGAHYMCVLLIENFPMFQTLCHDWHNGTKTGIDWYNKHMKELEDTIPEEKRLIMNVKEGWGPLCEFLGEEVPLYPFPKVNEMATFQMHATNLGMVMQQAAFWNMCKTLGSGAVGLLAVVLGVARWKRWI